MLERFLHALRTDDPGDEAPGATRERLKARFPAGAVRRMTQLGLLVGAALEEIGATPDDMLVYASQFGESRALEAYLESFPSASPTLFQTSIHPSGVQQGRIARQQPVPELFPLAGGSGLVGQAVFAALLSPGARVLLCGGEERGNWLVPVGAASGRTFAFALALGREPAGAIARLRLSPCTAEGALTLAAWFDTLHQRAAWSGPVLPGWQLDLVWL